MRRCLCVRWEDPVCPFFVRMFRCCYYVKEYIFRVCVSCVIFTEAGRGGEYAQKTLDMRALSYDNYG